MAMGPAAGRWQAADLYTGAICLDDSGVLRGSERKVRRPMWCSLCRASRMLQWMGGRVNLLSASTATTVSRAGGAADNEVGECTR